MIAFVSGTVAEKEARYALIEAGGVGYKVFATEDTLRGLTEGAFARLWTHHVVREDAEDLFGFTDEDDLALFELLITISGIGPKTALNILNIATAETLRHSITSGETAYLTKIGGIGKKTADKIILELKEKLGKETDGVGLKEEVDALEALKSLGYAHTEAREALKKVPHTTAGTSARIKAALTMLGK